MRGEYTDRYGYLLRYCILWETINTEYTTTFRWGVCDRWDAHKVLATFEERSEAVGVCRLMNSIEEETNDQETMGVA